MKLLSGTFIKGALQPGKQQRYNAPDSRQEQDHSQKIAGRLGHLCFISSRRGRRLSRRADQPHQVLMQGGVAGENAAAGEHLPPAREVGHEAARFPHQHDAGGDVPRIKPFSQ